MKKIIFFLILVLFISGCKKEKVDEYAMVTFMLGDVTKNSVNISIGDIIKEKDLIITKKDSFCDIKIGESVIRIKEKSKVIFSNLLRIKGEEKTTLGLQIGKMLCKPKKLLKSESFTVKTPTAIAGVRGTSFIVEADKFKTTRIKVLHGKVRVAKRLKQFENNTTGVLEVAGVVNKQEKIVITGSDVASSEKAVDEILKKESKKGKELILASVIEKSKTEVSFDEKKLKKFSISDYEKDRKQEISIDPIANIKKKPKKVIKKIIKILQKELAEPKPDGRLLVTRFEIYFIKNGRVLWEGKVKSAPKRQGNKLYIASGKYVFCALKDGPVVWRRKLRNSGKVKIEGDKLAVYYKSKKNYLNLRTGERL